MTAHNLTSALDKRSQYGFQRHISFSRASPATFELDPSVIEAI
jgi:hypothetical protein